MLSLSRSAYRDVLEHTVEDVPQEACGILAGSRTDECVCATTAYRITNAAATPRVAYELDPTEQLETMDAIEAAGRDVVGFYHSHPAGPPRLSETDRAQATWAGCHYLLVSLVGRLPYVDAWRWTGDAFEDDALTIS